MLPRLPGLGEGVLKLIWLGRHHKHCGIGLCSTGDHVGDEILVPWRIQQHESPAACFEEVGAHVHCHTAGSLVGPATYTQVTQRRRAAEAASQVTHLFCVLVQYPRIGERSLACHLGVCLEPAAPQTATALPAVSRGSTDNDVPTCAKPWTIHPPACTVGAPSAYSCRHPRGRR